ncbi:MAG: peptidase M50 [uncultured bacterium]|nr:MAG: peptidase M50 [uncultured bacterium]HBH18311.1 site-2 protease family protein [Cyanobacteria bacterium UBA9579]
MLLYYLFQLLLNNPPAFFIALFVLILPLLISITVHEWSHGMTAYLFGDPTPKQQGRLTFNPLAHLDPVGTLMLFIVGIGWAKPIEINPENIPGRTKQMLVALAGPASNFVMAILFSIILYVMSQYFDINLTAFEPETGIIGILAWFLNIIIQINIILGLFNMLPIPPLDGSNFVKWFLPENIAEAYYRKLAPFGMFILLLLLFTGAFRYIWAAARVVERFIFQVLDFILSPMFSSIFINF